jgi:microsomal dipeptidase-like Zn-dependent dipeptidase
MKTNFIDIHCHPAMKPYGKSFNSIPTGKNSSNRNHKKSIWHYDPPTFTDKVANIITSLTKFTQTDLSTVVRGGGSVLCVSMYPLEKGFVLDKLGNNIASDTLKNIVTGLGRKRIDHIQEMSDYFEDLKDIYQYYRQLDGTRIKIDNQKFSYKLVNSFEEIQDNLTHNPNTINLILTIEGANVFNSGLTPYGRKLNKQEVLENIDEVKAWDHRLLFISPSHHFYNEMCGHAQTLTGLPDWISRQEWGMNEGFTDFGEEVVEKLLDNSSGKRILIDIKHLSVKSRNRYYEILAEKYSNQKIPLIVSHGAVTGEASFNTKKILMPNAYKGKFNNADVNFYDNELELIARSDGLFGIMLDERRVAGKKDLARARWNISRRKMLEKMSKLIWNQIQHIAEVLNDRELFAWGIQCIGSDFDGMVNPINGFWTAEQMPLLEIYLEKHAEAYLRSDECSTLKSYNKISAEEIVDRFMHENTMDFFRDHF